MKLGKRLMTICLALTLFAAVCACLQPVEATAATIASGSCGNRANWKLDDTGKLTISGSGLLPYRDYQPGITPGSRLDEEETAEEEIAEEE